MRRASIAIALIFALSACGRGGVSVGMKEAPIDITYGAQGTPSPASRPLGAGLGGTTFPGFISPPVLLPPPVTNDPPPVAVETCPTADPFAVPARSAGSTVDGLPRMGGYGFVRDGWVQTARTDDPRGQAAVQDAPKQPLSPRLMRFARNAHRVDANVSEYDIVQQDGYLKTTTTYSIDNTSGMYIKRIVTERADLPPGPIGSSGVESFNPQPMIKIFNLPFVPERVDGGVGTPTQESSGVDPLTGVYMQTYFRTVDHERIDACGTVLDAWMIRVSGSFQRPNVRQFNFSGNLAIAPQLGGLIIRDEVLITGGRDDAAGLFFQQQSSATVTAPEPEVS